MAMAMREQQERRSPPLETTQTASADEPQMATITGGSAATSSMATAGDMAGSGAAAGEEERGLEGAIRDNVRSSSSGAALLSAVSSTNKVSMSSVIASPQLQRKPRTHVVRPAAPSPHWLGFKTPVLPPAPPAKKKQAKRKAPAKAKKKCLLCGAAETPRWRTWPTDLRVVLCNACGIQVRKPGAVVPELVYLPHPATAATTPTAVSVSELEEPVAPRQEIQPVSGSPAAAHPKKVRVKLPPPATPTTTLRQPFPREIEEPESPTEPDSPILESLLDTDIYLLKRTSPRRKKSPPPPPPTTTTTTTMTTAEPAAAPAPGNRKRKRAAKRCCYHCDLTRTSQWRTGPKGEGTLCNANACGVVYGRGGLVPEYRPKASPSFNALVHSNQHCELPAPYLPVKPRMKRRKHKGQQQQPAQVGKKREEQNQQTAQAQPAAVAAVHQAHDDGDDDDERLPPEPALLKLRRQRKGKEHRRPPQPAAATQPRAAGNEMLQDLNLNLPPPPPPPPAQPHGGDDDLMMGPPDPFLFDGPSAPMIIENKKAVIVIVIDDD